MGFNPLIEKGIPLDDQVRTWSELNTVPYGKNDIHPYTRCRVIAMNGAGFEAVAFSHQFNRHTDVPELKAALAQTRAIEQQQQRAVNWLIPGEESTLEVTLGYQVAGQCFGLQAGGEGPLGKAASRSERVLGR
ncbi:hypothetical protein MXD59_05260, partial [Frankia sp. Ag45/Mut15]|nr:hypothetical protein [Frankia umida]